MQERGAWATAGTGDAAEETISALVVAGGDPDEEIGAGSDSGSESVYEGSDSGGEGG